MQKIYVEFTKPKEFSLISSGIRIVQKTDYSHVRFKYGDQIYEAAHGSVSFIGPPNQQSAIVVDSYEIKLSPVEFDKFMDICMYFSGTPYGGWQIVGFLIANMFGFRRNPLGDKSKTQICSEIVYRVLNQTKGLSLGRNIDLIGPKEINEALFNSPQIAMKLEK
jgi:hypothetical protein